MKPEVLSFSAEARNCQQKYRNGIYRDNYNLIRASDQDLLPWSDYNQPNSLDQKDVFTGFAVFQYCRIRCRSTSGYIEISYRMDPAGVT